MHTETISLPKGGSIRVGTILHTFYRGLQSPITLEALEDLVRAQHPSASFGSAWRRATYRLTSIHGMTILHDIDRRTYQLLPYPAPEGMDRIVRVREGSREPLPKRGTVPMSPEKKRAAREQRKVAERLKKREQRAARRPRGSESPQPGRIS